MWARVRQTFISDMVSTWNGACMPVNAHRTVFPDELDKNTRKKCLRSWGESVSGMIGHDGASWRA